MNYRAEITGLRTIAVIPVILFHAGFESFRGGYIGVDVFFVISGYLITTVIVDDIEHNRFSIASFYERRVRRIFPALFFVMCTCIPFAWMWMLPSQMKDFSQSLIFVSLSISNIFFWQASKENGYFSIAIQETPLLHTWSLAVEEQYYLLFPIFLVLAWRFRKHRVFWMIVGFAGISFALSEWGWRNSATANFYLAPTRVWELLAGSIVAFVVRKRGVRDNNILALLGIVAITVPIMTYDESTPFPSSYSLVPVIGVMLLVLFAGSDTFVAKFLSTKVMVGIGLISYSAYLWQQPLFAFAHIRSMKVPGQPLMAVLAAGSILLAALSWRLVEQPFRKKHGVIKSRTSVLFLSITLVFVFSTIGIGGHIGGGYPSRLTSDIVVIDSAASSVNPYRRSCTLGVQNDIIEHPISGCEDFVIAETVPVMLIGDSHLDSMSFEIQEELMASAIGSYSVSYAGCIGLSGFFRVDYDRSHQCHEFSQTMTEYARDIGVQTVVLISRLPLYLEGNRFDNGEGGVEPGGPVYIDLIENRNYLTSWDSEERKNRVEIRLVAELKDLLTEFNVVLVESVPEAGWTVPTYLAKGLMFNTHVTQNTSLDIYDVRNRRVNRALDSVTNQKFVRVNTANIFCSTYSRRCSLADENGSYYRDDNHLSRHGALKLAPTVVETILSTL